MEEMIGDFEGDILELLLLMRESSVLFEG